jgi:hypothetical protein
MKEKRKLVNDLIERRLKKFAPKDPPREDADCTKPGHTFGGCTFVTGKQSHRTHSLGYWQTSVRLMSASLIDSFANY